MIKLYHYNGTKLKDFYMGPSVKFVLPIIDAFPDKKNGGNFWCGKKGRNGGGWGGSEGVAFFGRKFSRLSFLNTSLSFLNFLISRSMTSDLKYPRIMKKVIKVWFGLSKL